MREPEIEIVSDELYPWATDNNEKRRAFILEYFNWNPDIHVHAQMDQLNQLERWLSGKANSEVCGVIAQIAGSGQTNRARR